MAVNVTTRLRRHPKLDSLPGLHGFVNCIRLYSAKSFSSGPELKRLFCVPTAHSLLCTQWTDSWFLRNPIGFFNGTSPRDCDFRERFTMKRHPSTNACVV